MVVQSPLICVLVSLCCARARIAGVLTVEEEEQALAAALLASRGEQEGAQEVVAASREELERAWALCEDPPVLPPLVLWRCVQFTRIDSALLV